MIHDVKEFDGPAVDLETGIVARHRSAARILAPALGANVPEGWRHCADQWAETLVQGEIIGIAYTALSILEPHVRPVPFELAHFGQTQPRMPMRSPCSPMSDARFWVRFATRDIRVAFMVATYDAVSLKDRAAFRAYAEANP